MTLNNVFESAIKEHIKEREDLQSWSFKGIKVINCEFVKSVKCYFPGTEVECPMMTQYEVTCKFNAKKHENNRVKFQVNVYSDGSEIGVYFDGTYYEV